MNKDILLIILTITQGVENKEETLINAAISDLNQTTTFTEDSLTYIKEYFRNTKQDITLMKNIVTQLETITNKEALLLFLELRANPVPTKDRLKEILLEEYSFDNEYDKYSTYSLLAKLIINTGDSELIKAAIDKVQNI